METRTATGSVHVLWAVAAAGLPGSRLSPPPEPLDDAGWAALVEGCRSANLVGFLAAAVGRGTLAATDAQRVELDELHRAALARTAAVAAAAARTSTALTALGVDHRVVDGPVVVARYRRAGSDGPPARVVRGCRILLGRADAAELARRDPPPGAATAGAGRTAPAEDDDEAGPRVELRADVLPGWTGARLGLAQAGPPLPVSVATDAGDEALPGLSTEAQLVVACARAGRGSSRLLALRDVAQLVLDARLDAERLTRLCADSRVPAVVTQGIRAAWTTFELADKTPLSVWAFRYDASSAEQRALGSYLGSGRARGGLTALPGGIGTVTRRLRLRRQVGPPPTPRSTW